MKSLIASILILGLVGMLVGVAATATDEASVTATVTVQNISVAVSDGTVLYGIWPVNTTTSTLPSGLDDTQTATNDGNVTEDFNIRGQNSDWTLAATSSIEQYVHEFSTNGGGSWTALTIDSQTLATGKTPEQSQTFDLQITTPTATASYDQQSVNVTVQAIAG